MVHFKALWRAAPIRQHLCLQQRSAETSMTLCAAQFEVNKACLEDSDPQSDSVGCMLNVADKVPRQVKLVSRCCHREGERLINWVSKQESE